MQVIIFFRSINQKPDNYLANERNNLIYVWMIQATKDISGSVCEHECKKYFPKMKWENNVN